MLVPTAKVIERIGKVEIVKQVLLHHPRSKSERNPSLKLGQPDPSTTEYRLRTQGEDGQWVWGPPTKFLAEARAAAKQVAEALTQKVA